METTVRRGTCLGLDFILVKKTERWELNVKGKHVVTYWGDERPSNEEVSQHLDAWLKKDRRKT